MIDVRIRADSIEEFVRALTALGGGAIPADLKATVSPAAVEAPKASRTRAAPTPAPRASAPSPAPVKPSPAPAATQPAAAPAASQPQPEATETASEGDVSGEEDEATEAPEATETVEQPADDGEVDTDRLKTSLSRLRPFSITAEVRERVNPVLDAHGFPALPENFQITPGAIVTHMLKSVGAGSLSLVAKPEDRKRMHLMVEQLVADGIFTPAS